MERRISVVLDDREQTGPVPEELEHFGGVRAVLAAEEDELASVAGIGGQTARRIGWAVKEPRARYKLGLS